ncbi:hypothetical protein [Marinitoga aeolica]|uniref:Uncharacterized protein n=1 Tax=Marinitoga aeolica TaxID=2809031 RepID=A0ABY8PQM4_9BACT|nr:hypothetical protein [Marinitoga aeolica]WGS64915.1 hypothetical protein JRV97_11255 [Marinitoga aeolica]
MNSSFLYKFSIIFIFLLIQTMTLSGISASVSALNAIFWFVIGYILLKITIINIWKYKN